MVIVDTCSAVYLVCAWPASKRSLLQMRLEIRVLERHIAIAKIRILQRGARSRRQGLPGDQGLLAAHGVGSAQLVVQGPDAEVADLGPVSVEREIGGLGVEVAVRGGGEPEHLSAGDVGAREPHHDTLPVVPVAET